MPFTRIYVTPEEVAEMLKLARAQEAQAAKDQGRKPRRITLNHAAIDCFNEGLEDLRARSSDFEEQDDDE